MIDSFLIASRETLEASLVVGIVLSYLSRTNNNYHKRSVYYGIIAGILVSIFTAFLFTIFAGGFEGKSEEIFEGTTMVIGAFLISTMILWMSRHRSISKNIESKVGKHLAHSDRLFSHLGIFLLIFVAILREGVETVIFMNAIRYANGISFIAGSLGILTSIIIGYLFFMSAKKISLKHLFNVSSILLILFASGLVAHGVHEFEDAGLVSGIITPLFDINPSLNADGSYNIFHENGLIGSFLKGLFGYNGNPSLLEVMAYLAYLSAISAIYFNVSSTKRTMKL